MSVGLSLMSKAITGEVTAGTQQVRFPGVKFNVAEGLSNLDVSTLGTLALNVAQDIANVTQVVRTAYCVGSAITNPTMMLNVLGDLANTALGVAQDIANRVLSLVKNQITQAMSQINGTITGLLNNVTGFLNAVTGLLDTIKSVTLNLSLLASADFDDWMSQEECEFMFAMMGACLLSKVLGNKLQDFTNEVTSKITNIGTSLNGALSESLGNMNNISGFIEKEKFMMEKANKQIKGVYNLI